MSETQGGRPMTLGERRVRISFNPNQVAHVNELKQQAAAFIDYCQALRGRASEVDIVRDGQQGEVHRLLSLAQDCIEVAAMHAVKAATLGLP